MATFEQAPLAVSLSKNQSALSKLLQRWRSKRNANTQQNQQPDNRRPFKPSPLPLILPQNQHTLSNLGWSIITFPQPTSSTADDFSPCPGHHPLQEAYQALFQASQAFFELPVSEKQKWKHKLGTEEGWTRVAGEKEFITLRTLSYTPDILKGPAKRYWDLTGAYLDSCLARISTNLNLPDGEEEGLRKYVGCCKKLGSEDREKSATMLRLFRYEGDEAKIVAEPHADLGLLSCVVGSVPGLEVWDGARFVDIERSFRAPAATLLVGRQLEGLSNGRFVAGGHRVVSYGRNGPPGSEGAQDSDQPKYRFSIVFVLRADEEVVVDTDALTTDVTGVFRYQVRGLKVGKWYDEIKKRHFNINTGLEEREEQRRKVQEMRLNGGGKGSG